MKKNILRGILNTAGATIAATEYVALKVLTGPFDRIMGNQSPASEAKELCKNFAREAAVEFGLVDE